MLYAGTPALKGDFTRTGQRTKMGLLQDGTNSAIRYVVNNFQDHRCTKKLLLSRLRVEHVPAFIRPRSFLVVWCYKRANHGRGAAVGHAS